MQFSTKDADNDVSIADCASMYQGAWWYNTCHFSNLNGHYFHEDETPDLATGVVWLCWGGYYDSLRRVTMKVRPEEFTPPGATFNYIDPLSKYNSANICLSFCLAVCDPVWVSISKKTLRTIHFKLDQCVVLNPTMCSMIWVCTDVVNL